MKKLGICLAVILFASSFAHAQEQQMLKWDGATTAEKYEQLEKSIAALRRDVGASGIQLLQSIIDRFPFSGIGIEFTTKDLVGTFVDQGNNVHYRILFAVTGVWKNSPTAKAGIKAGDYIVAINGTEVCRNEVTNFVNVNPDEKRSCTDAFVKKLRTSEANTFTIERYNFDTYKAETIETKVVGTGEFGNELKKFIVENLWGWLALLKSQEKSLDELAAKIEESKNDSQKLDNCLDDLNVLLKTLLHPWKDIVGKEQEFLE